MRDVVFVAVTVAFFMLCVGYVALCDRIVGDDTESVTSADQVDDGPMAVSA